MKIAGLVKSSLVDYPALVACVLFVPGCSYDCFYCHNRTLLEGSPALLDQDSVDAFLQKRQGVLDGVVVTGGEPSLQPDLVPFLQHLRSYGYQIKLDTNGSSPQVVQQVLDLGLCDYIAVDYKAPASRYREICGMGADPTAVLETIERLGRSGIDFEVRTTVVPQLSWQDLQQMALELPVLPRYVLNRYRTPETYNPRDQVKVETPPYTAEEILAFALKLQKNQPHIVG
jgi:pyruvate formate lyase activating enzyme